MYIAPLFEPFQPDFPLIINTALGEPPLAFNVNVHIFQPIFSSFPLYAFHVLKQVKGVA